LLCDILACAGGISSFNPTPLLTSASDYQGNLKPLTTAQLRTAVTKILGYKKESVDFNDLLSQRVVWLSCCCLLPRHVGQVKNELDHKILKQRFEAKRTGSTCVDADLHRRIAASILDVRSIFGINGNEYCHLFRATQLRGWRSRCLRRKPPTRAR
jgi:hypothetical protein